MINKRLIIDFFVEKFNNLIATPFRGCENKIIPLGFSQIHKEV
jgi:hypothetical protein